MRGVLSLAAIDSRSTAVVIADQLRERIIDGSFGPGDQINEAQVANQLNVSRGPVREALQRLVQEGLLIGRTNRGVFVRELTSRDVAEVYEAREVIECAAAETIVTQSDEAREQLVTRLEELTHQMRRPLAAHDWYALSRIDLAFHTALVDAGGNSRLSRAYETLATEALICLSQFENTYPVPDRVIPGHLEIAALLRGGDMDAIHRALHEHLSIDDMELHMHPAAETLRHGRSEAAART